MTYLERLNRILISFLISLVFIQAGLVFYLKHLQDEAEYRLIKNTTSVDMVCGKGQFSNSSYWDVLEKVSAYSPCSEGTCVQSYATWKREPQEKELHVISIEKAPSFEEENGGQVKVKVKASEKPLVLALVGRNYMEWQLELEEGAAIDKVIIAADRLVWLTGLPDNTEIEYLPKEKMCSYPYTWQEAFNPDNQFRSLIKALRQVSGVKETSFQGAKTGVEFVVPMDSVKRDVASLVEDSQQQTVQKPAYWRREQGTLVGDQFQFRSVNYPLPAGTKQFIPHLKSGRVFAIVKGLLQVWSDKTLKFEALEAPTTLPRLGYVESMAYNEKDQLLYLYNEQRSGELFTYKLNFDPNSQLTKRQKHDGPWELVREGFKRNLTALYYDLEKESLVGLVIRSSHFSELVHMDKQGSLIKRQNLKNHTPVDKKRWKWNLARKETGYWLHLATVQNPKGSWQQLY